MYDKITIKHTKASNAAVPKLTYFAVHGKCEAIRMLLHKAGVQFEDVHITIEQLTEMRESGALPAGCQVPFFEYQGRTLNQSNAILRMLGRQHNFYPRDNLDETYLIDWALEASLDLWASKASHAWLFEKNEEETEVCVESFAKFNR